MGSLHWLPSRTFKSDCDTEWSQSSIDRSWMLFHGMDFSCYWQEVWEFNLFRWFEKAWSWCIAFYVWEWWQIWLCDQRSWHKEASWIWYNNLLCFECQTVVEGWLWFVSVSKWCCFDLWWCVFGVFLDCWEVSLSWFVCIFSQCTSFAASWSCKWKMERQYDIEEEVRGILVSRWDIQVLRCKRRSGGVAYATRCWKQKKTVSLGIYGPSTTSSLHGMHQQFVQEEPSWNINRLSTSWGSWCECNSSSINKLTTRWGSWCWTWTFHNEQPRDPSSEDHIREFLAFMAGRSAFTTNSWWPEGRKPALRDCLRPPWVLANEWESTKILIEWRCYQTRLGTLSTGWTQCIFHDSCMGDWQNDWLCEELFLHWRERSLPEWIEKKHVVRLAERHSRTMWTNGRITWSWQLVFDRARRVCEG